MRTGGLWDGAARSDQGKPERGDTILAGTLLSGRGPEGSDKHGGRAGGQGKEGSGSQDSVTKLRGREGTSE